MIDKNLEAIPDFDSQTLQMSQLKLEIKRLVAKVDCIDTASKNFYGYTLFQRDG